MAKSDEFSPRTKKVLAERVSYRCSFPGCNRNTIGPQKGDSNKSSNLGEAAHITAASPGGPRYDSSLSKDERKSIDNGIWMCRPHARLIDRDYLDYSVQTIKAWKQSAENQAYKTLIEGTNNNFNNLMLIQITGNCIFYGEWYSIDKYSWSFTIEKFVVGDDALLNDICLKINEDKIEKHDNFVVIDFQGDGREINKNASIKIVENKRIITVNVKEKLKRFDISPEYIDIKTGEDGDIIFDTNNNIEHICGKEVGMQGIFTALSTAKGDRLYNPHDGSDFSIYFWKYKDDPDLLNSLLKIEIARLLTIPAYFNVNKEEASLGFINRISAAKILYYELNEYNRIPVSITVEFSDREVITDAGFVYIYENNHSHES
jgi:hypothetical protein